MTLVEFIAPLRNGTHHNRILSVLYYFERYEQKKELTVDEIRQGLKRARIKGWDKVNVADVLNKSGPLVDTDGLQGNKRLWSLTDSGREETRKLHGLPGADVEIEHDVGTLKVIIDKITDNDVQEYLKEALRCLQVGALRACVVFGWAATIKKIHTKLMSEKLTNVNAAIQKHDPKARTIKKIDDFAYIKDATILLAAMDLGLFDKNEKDTLGEALNLRNRCGHPSKYRPGVKKVSAFVEDITSIVFT